MPLSSVITRSFAKQAARDLIRSVAAAGGETADVLTALTSMTSHVLALAVPETADAEAVGMLSRMVAEMMPILREMEREGSQS